MFRSFQWRVFVLVVGLVFSAQLTTFLAVLTTIDREVKAEAGSDIDAGSQLAQQLIKKRADSLLRSAEVLAADFGFRSAMASKDAQTILSALSNSINRVDADIATLIDLDGNTVSSSGDSSTTVDVESTRSDEILYEKLLAAVRQYNVVSSLNTLHGQARQVVVVPVKAPIVIGWLVLGFALDDKVASELQKQTGLHVSFMSENSSGQVMHFGSTLPDAHRSSLPEALSQIDRTKSGDVASLNSEQFLTRQVKLDEGKAVVSVVLQTSLHAAFASYRALRNRLILLVTLSLLTALVLALWLSKGVTRPVSLLSAAAQRIKDGDYDTQLKVNRDDEFGQLAATFDTMQSGIASREAHIVHLANHDELTGLANRRMARQLLDECFMTPAAQESVAVLLVGLNRYRQVIETLGHTTGERLLQTLAQRLDQFARTTLVTAHVSADEFLLVVKAEKEAEIVQLKDDLICALTKLVVLDSAELLPDFSIGAVWLPTQASNSADSLRRVSIALADARESQRSLVFYVDGQDEVHRRRLSIVADLKQAVLNDELLLHFQPKVDMLDGRARSAEALVRWIHPVHGFMPPDEFIGLAESAGNISLLTNWVLRNVIKQISLWHDDGIDIRCAVNLSALDLQDDGLPERIANELGKFAVPTTKLILEVTESAMMRDTEQALNILRQLRQLGITISIDDFGTGYSSLAKLKQLPVDELKIDRAFILDLESSPADALIVKSIIDLGQGVGLKIITEGVETQFEWELLKDLGNDCVQGYFISKPLPPTEFAAWWHTHNKALDNDLAA